jgi:hypothetical protein
VGGQAVTDGISWIVATHDRGILEANLLATLDLQPADELVIIENAPSIAVAYNRGREQASRPIRCYIHHDVQVLNPARLRSALLEHCPTAGIVGVIGSREPVVPWWNGSTLGSVVDARLGRLDFGLGGECAFLDGLLLATSLDLEWDETYEGWHLYDHDMCRQALEAGSVNWCLTGGAELVRHNTAGSTNTHALAGWDEGVRRYREKYPPPQ